MDLRVPLRAIAPGLDADVLAVLAGTRVPLSGAAVARLAARGSRQGVQNVLDRLVACGLVAAADAPPARLYSPNRAHLLADAVLVAASAADRLHGRMADLLAGWEVPAAHASLFGSLARGTAGPSSDVDVLVVRSDAVAAELPAWTAQLQGLEEAVYAWTGNPLSVFETTGSGLRHAGSAAEPVVASWRRDGLLLAGRPLATLLAGAVA